MRVSKFGHTLAAMVAAVVLAPPTDVSAQCANAGSRGGMGMGPVAMGRGGGGAVPGAPGQMMMNGGRMNQAMQMVSMMQQAQMMQQINALRQQAMAGQRPMMPPQPGMAAGLQKARPMTALAPSISTAFSKPTKSRQERLREAIRERRREADEQRAARQPVQRRSSRIIVFNGAAKSRSSR